MEEFSIEIDGDIELIKEIERQKDKVVDIVRRKVRVTAEQIKQEARRNINKNPFSQKNINDTGTLKRSIQADSKDNWLTAEVGTSTAAEYAPHIEFGTAPHPVSIEHLWNWVARKILNISPSTQDSDLRSQIFIAAKSIAKKIGKKGTKAQPFLRPASKKYLNNFGAKLAEAIKRGIRT